jgi:hypothetical protein
MPRILGIRSPWSVTLVELKVEDGDIHLVHQGVAVSGVRPAACALESVAEGTATRKPGTVTIFRRRGALIQWNLLGGRNMVIVPVFASDESHHGLRPTRNSPCASTRSRNRLTNTDKIASERKPPGEEFEDRRPTARQELEVIERRRTDILSPP